MSTEGTIVDSNERNEKEENRKRGKLRKRRERRKRDDTEGGRKRVHELRQYVFKASPLGMTGRNSEIQERHHGIGPLFHRPCSTAARYGLCMLVVPTSVATDTFDIRIGVCMTQAVVRGAYRLPKVRERHNRV